MRDYLGRSECANLAGAPNLLEQPLLAGGMVLPAADEDPLSPSFAGHAAGNLRYAVQEPLCPVPLAGLAVLEHRGVELPRRATSDLASSLVRRRELLLLKPA